MVSQVAVEPHAEIQRLESTGTFREEFSTDGVCETDESGETDGFQTSKHLDAVLMV